MTDIYKGATDQSFNFELVDSTTGLPKTGVLYSAITAAYVRTRSAKVDITPATLASASAAHADGGFILVNDTTNPGVYRFDPPDAAFASGAAEVVITIIATGCRAVSRSFNLVNINNQIAYVPNAAFDAAGGLPISDAGGLDLDAKLATATSALATAAALGTAQSLLEDVESVVNGLETTVGAAGAGLTSIPNSAGVTTLLSRLQEQISLTPGGAVTVATNNDKTGYSLTATTGLGNQTANITGNLSGSVGSVTGGINTGSGTITTLDALDTAQDSQHATTQSAIGGLNNLSAAQVNSEVDTALADIHLDHLLAVDYDPASKPGVATALLNELIESDGGVSRYTANALEQAPSGGGSAPTAGEVADAIWDEILSGHAISGSAGAVLSGIGSVAGSGARTVAVTVTIDSVAISGAKVRVTKGGESYLQATNGSGQITFNLDDGTWVVSITSPGATFAGTTLVVDGNETVAYDMDAASLTPSDPDKVTAYYLCLDENGDALAGVDVGFSCQMPISASVAPTGLVIDHTERVEASGVDGIVEFVNTVPGFRYRVRLADESTFFVNIPLDADEEFPLGSVVGGSV